MISLWFKRSRSHLLQETLFWFGILLLAKKIIYGNAFHKHIWIFTHLFVSYRSKRSGYCVSTSNYHRNLIAAAEYGLNPEVHIYKYPGKDLVHKFKADTTIKVIDMVFSRDGRYLLIIGGIPDFKISIFDLDNNKKLNLSGISCGTT